MRKWVDKVVDIIKMYYDPDKIILFGSVAKNMTDRSSDIDLLIIKQTVVPQRFRGVEVVEHLEKFPVKFDLLFYTPRELEDAQRHPYSFISSILKKSEILYEKF